MAEFSLHICRPVSVSASEGGVDLFKLNAVVEPVLMAVLHLSSRAAVDIFRMSAFLHATHRADFVGESTA